MRGIGGCERVIVFFGVVREGFFSGRMVVELGGICLVYFKIIMEVNVEMSGD